MSNYVLIGLFALFCSCLRQEAKESKNIVARDTTFENKQTISQKEVVNINLDSIKKKILVSNASSLDTVKYQFSLEDVGTEGNEGTAYYLNDSIQKVEINIYTSMWKIYVLYLFDNTNIKVTERTYNIYDNIELIKSFSYTMDFNGIPLEKVDSDRIDIFQELKNAVPFELK
jgi:hypothetical protein